MGCIFGRPLIEFRENLSLALGLCPSVVALLTQVRDSRS